MYYTGIVKDSPLDRDVPTILLIAKTESLCWTRGSSDDALSSNRECGRIPDLSG